MKARIARLESIRNLARLLVAGALAVSAAGSAQDTPSATKTVDARELDPRAEEACLVVRQIRNFDALGDRYVFVEGRRSERYLLTMLPGCIGLRSAFGIAIESRGSRVCTGSGADIRYRGLGGRTETCPIRRVETVEDKASAEQLVELRARQR